jgi:hypothetical protein
LEVGNVKDRHTSRPVRNVRPLWPIDADVQHPPGDVHRIRVQDVVAFARRGHDPERLERNLAEPISNVLSGNHVRLRVVRTGAVASIVQPLDPFDKPNDSPPGIPPIEFTGG